MNDNNTLLVYFLVDKLGGSVEIDKFELARFAESYEARVTSTDEKIILESHLADR
jgi:hypothetical protein